MRPAHWLLTVLFAVSGAATSWAGESPDPLSLGIDLGIDSTEQFATDADTGHLGLDLDLEAWLQHSVWRSGNEEPGTRAQAALDFRRELQLSPTWRATVSNRFETTQAVGEPHDRETRNMLREAFVTWRNDSPGAASGESDAVFLDVGRLNQRLGVAAGYNPTDYFREGAVVSSISRNPATLRQNRLGTFSARAQWISAAQTWTVAWVPQLTTRETIDTDEIALGLERTNRREALLIRWAPRLDERASLDIPVLFRNSRVEVGVNATALLSDALVGTLEMSVASREPLPDLTSTLSGAEPASRNTVRAAIGGTWTTAVGPSLTLERHYAGDALSKEEWNDWRNALRQPAAISAAATRTFSQIYGQTSYRQDLLVRDMWFARAAWDDAFGQRGLNLSAFVRLNPYDHSRTWQAEVAWNDRRDWSLRLLIGGNRGDAASEFGSRDLRTHCAASVTFFW